MSVPSGDVCIRMRENYDLSMALKETHKDSSSGEPAYLYNMSC